MASPNLSSLYVTPRTMIVTMRDGSKKDTTIHSPEQEIRTDQKFSDPAYKAKHGISTYSFHGDKLTYNSPPVHRTTY